MQIQKADLVHLARFAIAGDTDNARAIVQRIGRRLASSDPEVATALESLVADAAAATRAVPQPVPVDLDSRLELLRTEHPKLAALQPIWPAAVAAPLQDMVEQRERSDDLAQAGLLPPRSMLLSGPPGVGKTLAARYIAARLDRPLHTLDLSAVMSSYLGKTGGNVRAVLDFAKRRPCVLLLDEFDAIAKRRDDAAEVGELKRLVTVLLQAVDDWPASGVLIAATNHADLLDPAVWRRFDLVVRFPMPNTDEVRRAVVQFLGALAEEHPPWVDILTLALDGGSFADVQREILLLRRAVVMRADADEQLGGVLSRIREGFGLDRRKALARSLESLGYSQRRISEWTGISRDTLRAHRQKSPTTGGEK
jgi:MoxR-like ATPase